MKPITLPRESNITIHKDGTSTVEHTAFVTGVVGQEFAQAAVELMGGSVEELVRDLDKPTREASCG